MPETNGAGLTSFVTKALVVVMTLILGGLSTFFYWLAGETIDIGKRMTQIEGRAVSIDEKVTSLLNTRSDQAAEQASRNQRRIETLERDQGQTPKGQ